MKYLIATFALFTSSLCFATNYTFKQSLFSAKAALKNASDKSELPALELSGHALWMEDADNNNSPSAQITIRRTTYDCDSVSSGYAGSPYTCNLTSAKLLQILDDVATHDTKYAEAVQVLKNYYNDPSLYEYFEVPLGTVNQSGETATTKDIDDPVAQNLRVEFTLKTTGLHSL